MSSTVHLAFHRASWPRRRLGSWPTNAASHARPKTPGAEHPLTLHFSNGELESAYAARSFGEGYTVHMRSSHVAERGAP